MTDGSYDINGKCVNCGCYHPCNCEVNDTTEREAMDLERLEILSGEKWQ